MDCRESKCRHCKNSSICNVANNLYCKCEVCEEWLETNKEEVRLVRTVQSQNDEAEKICPIIQLQRNRQGNDSVMKELTKEEKDYLLTILYKQDWTETEICDSIIRKLGLSKTVDGS